MAIAKVGSTGSSAGAIQYVLSENREASKQPEILAGSFGTQAEIKREFEIYNKLNTRVKNQATHISVSFALGEKIKTEKKIEFAEKLLEKLDFKNVPFLVVEHHDKEYEHFHIIAGRIRDDGTTVKEWKIAVRAIEATKELEKSLGLQRTEYTKSGDRRIKTNEFKQMERTNDLSVMAEAKLTIDEILTNQPTTEEFVVRLQRFGFDVRPNISEKTGRMNGFSFKKGEIKFKSSAIARNYSWQNLQKNGLKYDHARDTEFLIGVKNEFTQKLNFENGRDQGTETPKPIAERTESITDRAESGIDRSKSTSGKTDRSKVGKNRNQTAGLLPDDPKAEFSEILSFAPALDASKQPAQTKISDRTVFESGHREKLVGSERNSKDNSGSEKSSDSQFIQLEVSFFEPQLNPAPERETEKEASKNKDREKSYGNIMSR
jgi:hypothetical protein